MFNLVKYFITFAFFGILVSSVSIIWPKFSRNRRPEMLEKTYQLVKNTKFGTETARVLGVSDEKFIQPVSLESFTKEKVTSVSSIIQQKLQSIIVTQAMVHLLNQYNSLSSGQKQHIRDLICVPDNK